MPAGLVYLICQILLALVLLAGCRPVYYGAVSIVEFEDGEKHALLGRDFRRVITQLGEPTDIIFDKSKSMIWIYEVDEASSNPLQILPALTAGLRVKRKILTIDFDHNRRLAGSHIRDQKLTSWLLLGVLTNSRKRLSLKNG